MCQQDTWAGKQGIDKHGTWRIASLAPQHGVEQFETFDYERPLSDLKALQNVSTQRQTNSLFRGFQSFMSVLLKF